MEEKEWMLNDLATIQLNLDSLKRRIARCELK